MSEPLPSAPCRLTRFGLVAVEAEALARFYKEAFDGCREAPGQLDARQSESLLGVPGKTRYMTVRLGAEPIDFLQFEQSGRPYPPGSSACDLLFQHFAIVVSEMRLALERLHATRGWTAITQDGPQRLPQSSGGVMAFKFRDPAGHPLELLEFPLDNIPQKWRDRRGNVFLGIDHSAITVRDTATSERFYSRLGFSRSARSINRGAAQERLDNVPGAVVEVTALSGGGEGPHIELLCYRGVSKDTPAVGNNDIAATRLELGGEGSAGLQQHNGRLLDPDGHHLVVRNCALSQAIPMASARKSPAA